jgi:hypothetical protein
MAMAKKGDRTLDPGDETEPRVPEEQRQPDPTKPVSSSNPAASRGTRLPSTVTPLTEDSQGNVPGEPADPNVPDVTQTTDLDDADAPVQPEQQVVRTPTAKAPSPAATKSTTTKSPVKTSGGHTAKQTTE